MVPNSHYTETTWPITFLSLCMYTWDHWPLGSIMDLRCTGKPASLLLKKTLTHVQPKRRTLRIENTEKWHQILKLIMNLKCSGYAPVLLCSLCQLSQVTVHEEEGVQDSLTFQRLQIMLLEQFGKYVIDILIFCSVIMVISWAILWWFHTEVIHFTLLNSAMLALILKKACLSFVCRWSTFWCSSEASFVLSSLVSDRPVWSCEYNGWRFIAMCKTFNPLYSLIILLLATCQLELDICNS